MSEIELKPCLFCGSEAAVGYEINDYNCWVRVV